MSEAVFQPGAGLWNDMWFLMPEYTSTCVDDDARSVPRLTWLSLCALRLISFASLTWMVMGGVLRREMRRTWNFELAMLMEDIDRSRVSNQYSDRFLSFSSVSGANMIFHVSKSARWGSSSIPLWTALKHPCWVTTFPILRNTYAYSWSLSS